jgi:hypothetical protein
MELSLDGVTIDSSDGPAINIRSSKRTFVVLEDGKANALNDSGASASWSARTLSDGTDRATRGRSQRPAARA